jgi:hypothetical protein
MGGFVTTSEQITAALEAHDQWLGCLRAAMATGGTNLRVEQIRDDRLCEFGRWLRSPEVDTETRKSQLYCACVELHRRLHLAAGDVITLVTAGRAYPSPELVEAAQQFHRVSHQFAHAMLGWLKSEALEPVVIM